MELLTHRGSALALCALAVLAIALAPRMDRLRLDPRLGPIVDVAPPVRAAPERASPPPPPAPERDDPWLAAVVERVARGFPAVRRDPEAHRLQILVTRFERGVATGSYGYRVDAEYFYPASAIKPFVALAALAHLEDLAATHGALTIHTPLALCLPDEVRCSVMRDPTNVEGGAVTVGHEIRKMLLVSSNVAFNRLFDFVGHETANRSLRAMGFASIHLAHRIGGGAPGGHTSPPYDVLLGDGIRIERRTSRLPIEPLDLPGVGLGRAHYDDEGDFIEEPADFRLKNYASLRDHQRLLLAIVGVEGSLPLSVDHRRFLMAAMEDDPLRSDNPPYRGARYAESRFKVMLRGIARVLPRASFRHVGKAGRAYGFEVDNAYVEHRNGRAFAVTAVMYANPNQVINDDGYAYDLSAGFFEAFGAELARELIVRPPQAKRTE